MRAAVAEAAHTSTRREFHLLALLGRDDLQGAIRAIPTDTLGEVVLPPDAVDPAFDDNDPLLKFSLAGTQLKFSVYDDKAKGLVVPAKGRAGNVIAKMPDGRLNRRAVPESELACLRLADLSGISTPEAWLVDPHTIQGLGRWADAAPGRALAVRRFDRFDRDRRIHMEELAQVLNIPAARETEKYSRANFETVARFVAALCGVEAVAEVIDRIVLNVLVGNGDAHLKNWAILYPDGKTPVLSPLYDVLPTVVYIPADNLGMNLARSKSFEDVVPASFDTLAARSNYGVDLSRQRVKQAVARVLDNWSSLSDYLPSDSYDFLTRRLNTLSLVTTYGLTASN